MCKTEAAIYKSAGVGFIRTGITRDSWGQFINKKKYVSMDMVFFGYLSDLPDTLSPSPIFLTKKWPTITETGKGSFTTTFSVAPDH